MTAWEGLVEFEVRQLFKHANAGIDLLERQRLRRSRLNFSTVKEAMTLPCTHGLAQDAVLNLPVLVCQ